MERNIEQDEERSSADLRIRKSQVRPSGTVPVPRGGTSPPSHRAHVSFLSPRGWGRALPGCPPIHISFLSLVPVGVPSLMPLSMVLSPVAGTRHGQGVPIPISLSRCPHSQLLVLSPEAGTCHAQGVPIPAFPSRCPHPHPQHSVTFPGEGHAMPRLCPSQCPHSNVPIPNSWSWPHLECPYSSVPIPVPNSCSCPLRLGGTVPKASPSPRPPPSVPIPVPWGGTRHARGVPVLMSPS